MTDRLTWTTDKPTEPGAYWFKHSQGEWHVVYVKWFNGRLASETVFVGQRSYEHIDYMHGIWAGPIPEPENE